jgi:hypothetical protein
MSVCTDLPGSVAPLRNLIQELLLLWKRSFQAGVTQQSYVTRLKKGKGQDSNLRCIKRILTFDIYRSGALKGAAAHLQPLSHLFQQIN